MEIYIFPGAVDNINIMESGIISEITTWSYLEIIPVPITQRCNNKLTFVVSFRLLVRHAYVSRTFQVSVI